MQKLKEKGITTYIIRQKGLIPQGILTKMKMCSGNSWEEIENNIKDQLWKVNHKLVKNFFFISVVKKGNFNRAPLGCFFKIYRYWYTDLLFEVKFDIVGEHFPDDSDKFAGTMPKCIVMRPAFSPLGIIISLEGCVVSDNVPSCIYKGIS